MRRSQSPCRHLNSPLFRSNGGVKCRPNSAGCSPKWTSTCHPRRETKPRIFSLKRCGAVGPDIAPPVKITLDTTILVRAFDNTGSLARPLLSTLLDGGHVLVFSSEILAETSKVL